MRKTLAAIAVMALCLGTVWADPELGTYNLTVVDGNITNQSGTGYPYPTSPGEFYYYPIGGWWNMWWPNEFSAVDEKLITIKFFITWSGAPPEVAFNWSTMEWGNPVQPPLPGSDAFIARVPAPPLMPGQTYYEASWTIPFCPLWVSVDIRGSTFNFTGIIQHECLVPGACCYGPPDQCVCVNATWPECQGLSGEFHPGEACDTYKCDTEAPDITCPANITLECDESTDPEQTGVATATDICDPDPTIGHSDTPDLTGCGGYTGTIVRTWTATDDAGNSSTCDQILTIVDTTPPTLIGCPDEVLVIDCADEVPEPADVTAEDNCDDDVDVEYVEVRTDNECCGYQLVRTWSATDDCGLSSSCTQTITVQDTETPVIDVDATVTPATGICEADVEFVVTVTDNCCVRENDVAASLKVTEGNVTFGSVTVTKVQVNSKTVEITLSTTATLAECEGKIGVLVFAVDCCGNTATGEMEPLSNGLFSESWAGGAPGQPGNMVHAWSDPFILSWELSGPTLVTTILLSDTVDPDGNGERVYKTDYTGGYIVLSGQWQADIIDYVHYTHQIFANHAMTDIWTCVVAHALRPDALQGVTVTALARFVGQGTGFPGSPYPPFLPPGYMGPGGWGNVLSLQMAYVDLPTGGEWEVDVKDASPPTFTCPADITVNTDPDVCTASVTLLVPPDVSDNCDPDPTVTYWIGATQITSPHVFTKGTTTVTVKVEDECDNVAECTFTVTVNDAEPPEATCPGDITQDTDPGQCCATVTFTATATDNCPGVGIACVPLSGYCFPIGDTTVTCTATDASGNIDTCSFKVTVNDASPLGACCVGTECTYTTKCACDAITGAVWKGEGTDCFPNPCLPPMDYWLKLGPDPNEPPIEQGGTGTPPEWIYYPATNWWNMWWPNEFDLDRQKLVVLKFWIDFPDPTNPPVVAFNWSAPTWPDPINPPLDDAFIVRLPVGPPILTPGYYEFVTTIPYCPRWVSVDVMGLNFAIQGTIFHDCLGDVLGACCFDDGSCQELTEAACLAASGHLSWKGPHTDCISPANPRLTLTATALKKRYVEGDTVTVILAMKDICSDVVSGDFYLEWDPLVLAFVSANPVDTTEFAESAEVLGSGTLDYSLYGVGLPPFQVTGSYDFATLKFTALQTVCEIGDIVKWRTHTPSNRLSDAFGSPVVPSLVNVPATSGNNDLSLLLNVQLEGAMPWPSFTRCIHIELWTCLDTAPHYTDNVTMTFTNGQASVLLTNIPCAAYTCITAQDKLHTLRRTADDSTGGNFINYAGEPLVANFVGNPASGGDWLIGGNLNALSLVGDNWIDALDFGVFAWQYTANPTPGANTTCSTPFPHADVNGDGLVDTLEFSFIFSNYKKTYEPNCCGQPGLRDDGPGPVTRISVDELIAQGMGELAAGDINGDGWLDEEDMALFGSGLPPPVHVGDVNCDGVVNFGDINPFVLAISNPAGWQQAYPTCSLLNADANGDGSVDVGDINPFIALLQQ